MSYNNTPPQDARTQRPPTSPAITRFEECSLALFAALAIGTFGAPARAQPPRAAEPVHTASPVGGRLAASATRPSDGVRAAFVRADANGDGRLSREEAARLPVVHERFDEMDTDHDQFLSREEFYKGVDD